MSQLPHHIFLLTPLLTNDPGVAGLLEKVAVLKQRMSARRSLGGLLADKASKRAGRKHHKRDRGSRRPKRKRSSDARSGTSSLSDKGNAFDLVSARDGNRIQVTSQREPGKLLALGLRHVEKFWAQRGGADSETNSDELATGVLQYLTSVFHGAHPQSSMSLRNSRNYGP